MAKTRIEERNNDLESDLFSLALLQSLSEDRRFAGVGRLIGVEAQLQQQRQLTAKEANDVTKRMLNSLTGTLALHERRGRRQQQEQSLRESRQRSHHPSLLRLSSFSFFPFDTHYWCEVIQ